MLKVIVSTIKDAKEHVASYGEALIDLAVDNDAWSNIPLVEHAVKILNIADTYKLNLLKRNYAAFIKAVSCLDSGEAELLLQKIKLNTELSEESTEVIFHVIVNSFGSLKSELLGNSLVAVARGSINLEEFNTLALIVESGSIAALRCLPAFLDGNENKLYRSIPSAAPHEGLLFSLGVATRHGNMFRLDENARKLAEFGFGIQLNT